MQPYPQNIDTTIESVTDSLRTIARLRAEDITDRNSFPAIFMKGRKVGKLPSSSSDVVASDRVGDFNYTASYLYILVDNSGTASWRRAALGSW